MYYYRGIKRYIPMLVAIGLIVLILILGMISGWFEGGAGSSKPADIYSVFHMKDANGARLGTDMAALVLQSEIQKDQAKIVEGEYYVEFDFAQTLNSRFYWDEKEHILVYTTPTDVIKVTPGKKAYQISGKNQKLDFTAVLYNKETEVVQVDLKFIQLFTNIQYTIYNDPGRVLILNDFSEEFQYGTVSGEVSIREEGNSGSGIIRTLEAGEELTVFDQGARWTKVTTADGLVGYVRTGDLSITRTELVNTGFEEPVYTSVHYDDKISMVWHQVSGIAGNDTLTEYMQDVKSVNVITPTWFKLKDTQGNMESYATSAYVEEAHRMGLKVWGLIDDFESDDAGNRYIRSILPRTSRRARLIRQLMAEVKAYNLDGINVDFEYINTDNGENYIQFLRELSVECRKAGIVLSVDNYVASAWTFHYDRKEQGIVCDYLIIMGYDEHTVGSEEAGSVASLPFVISGIEKTIEEVGSSEKVINALPFYTRIWFENENGGISSEAVGMDEAEARIAEYKAKKNWSEEEGQYYCEYSGDGGVYKIWLEDSKSVARKLDLMNQYNLAGAAYWRLHFESSDIWRVVSQYFK